MCKVATGLDILAIFVDFVLGGASLLHCRFLIGVCTLLELQAIVFLLIWAVCLRLSSHCRWEFPFFCSFFRNWETETGFVQWPCPADPIVHNEGLSGLRHGVCFNRKNILNCCILSGQNVEEGWRQCELCLKCLYHNKSAAQQSTHLQKYI